jgi:hypothetical protein
MFNRSYGIVSQKTEPCITTAVRTSVPTTSITCFGLQEGKQNNFKYHKDREINLFPMYILECFILISIRKSKAIPVTDHGGP